MSYSESVKEMRDSCPGRPQLLPRVRGQNSCPDRKSTTSDCHTGRGGTDERPCRRVHWSVLDGGGADLSEPVVLTVLLVILTSMCSLRVFVQGRLVYKGAERVRLITGSLTFSPFASDKKRPLSYLFSVNTFKLEDHFGVRPLCKPLLS